MPEITLEKRASTIRSGIRIASIDVLRALTMFLMVFVNDLWTDKGIPSWLDHASATADGMGFADTIFPAFLFLVGLSLPFAFESRMKKGQSKPIIFKHILLRSLALIVMGFFQMNLERYNDHALLPKYLWEILITLAFFLIWLDYPKGKDKHKLKLWLQIIGVATLVLMAALYKGANLQGETVWMDHYWWGILGLIGWAYLSCGILLLIFGEKLVPLICFFAFFVFFNSLMRLDGMGVLHREIDIFGLGDASNASVTMAGVIIAIIYRKLRNNQIRLITLFVIIAGLFFAFGFGTRPLWGISKIRATPSWTTICIAISLLVFCLLIILVDKKEKESWFTVIKPAGTSTLT
ncbi:MAG: heparan-alpha-glucosaminide N-acetyltransferase domain-containing protein, partial [Chitinophagaceae bacterium]